MNPIKFENTSNLKLQLEETAQSMPPVHDAVIKIRPYILYYSFQFYGYFTVLVYSS